MNQTTKILLCALFFITQLSYAQDVEYRPSNDKFNSTWTKFYNGDHEPELDDPLIEAGKNMTMAICEAVKNKDMKFRRYAIGALGYIGDERALPTLELILKSKDEIDYFRGDALQAIYQLNKQLAKQYAKTYGPENAYLTRLQRDIEKDAKYLTEPTEE